MTQNNNYPFTWENQEEGTVITLVEQMVSSTEGNISNEDLENALDSIGLKSDESGLVYSLMVNGKEAGKINIPEDQFLKNVNYNQEEKKLIFTFNTENESGETSVEVSIADLVDIYTSGNGIEVSQDKKINVIISPNSQKYIEIGEDGIKIVGIDEALSIKADKSDLEGLASEQWVEEKKYLQEVPETWATDEEVSKAVESKADIKMLDVYAKLVDVETTYQVKGDYALKSEIPTKVGQLENDVPYIIEHQDVSMFATKDELNNGLNEKANIGDSYLKSEADDKFLTEHQDISSLATKEEVKAESDRAITNEGLLQNEIDKKANVGDSYTKEESDSMYIKEHQDVSMFSTKEELKSESERAIAKEAEIEASYKAADESLQTSIDLKVGEVKLEKGESDLQYNLFVDGSVVGTINIPQDQFLKNASYDSEKKEIVFVFNTENGENTVNVNISDLVDTYTAGKGLMVVNNRFEVVIDGLSEQYISVSENGIKLSGINAKFDEKEDKGVAYSKTEADALFLKEHQDISMLASRNELNDEIERASIKENELEASLNMKAEIGSSYTKEESDSKYLTEHQDISHLATNAMFEEMKAYINRLEQRIIILENRVYSSSDLFNLIGNLSEGETTLEIYNDVLVSGDEPMIIPENAVLNLKMNGKTINYQGDDILFRVNGTLNISGGKVYGDGYVASANKGGVINVEDGDYKTEVSCFQCNGGIVNINGGHYDSYSEEYGRVYTLNHIDSKKNEGVISVTGGTFVGYNPAESPSEYPAMNFVAEGYESVPVMIEGVECYSVVKKSEISTKDEMIEAISNVKEGEILALNVTDDIILEDAQPMVISKGATVAINLNNHKFVNSVKGDPAITNNGELVINGGDFVNGNNEVQEAEVIRNNGILTINGGNIGSYENRGAAVLNKGICTINGGNFLSIEKGTTNDNGWAYVFINIGENAVMNINNATVDGNVQGIFSTENGTINVNGGFYRMGEKGKQTFYIAYVEGNGTINLNGGEYYWTKGASNVSTYVTNGGAVNIAEGVKINETR